MSTTRQLAAIMFADIVGYTALMQEDEVLALQKRNKFKSKLEQEVSQHNGTIIEFRGDGALCTFNSTNEGVQAAIRIQTEMQTEPVVPLRIGMHTGDVIVEDHAVYGDGVNIASRMESMAVPGSILISFKAYDDIKNQRDILAVCLGKFNLKNVKEQMEVYAISNAGIKVPKKINPDGKGKIVNVCCVLVLPFVNMSTDPEQEYFSDGLTEELITNLSRIKTIRVLSRTTSMKYKGTTKDAKTISKETDVSHIVEGSVRKHGNNIRITAQFIDASRDMHLWADSYSGTLDDIFNIQEKVSMKIVGELKLHLTGDDKDILQKRFTDNSEAYQLYLQGRYFWKKRNAESIETAIRHFQNAIEKDPDFALAWAGIADAYSLMGEYTGISRKELFPKVMMAVTKALAIDNRLAEAHVSLGICLMLNEWDWKNAERELKLGIELNPNYATGHHWYAELLLFTGRAAEAFREIDLAIELDPVSAGIMKDKGIFYYYTRQYEKAIKTAKITMELEPGFAAANRLMSLSYTGLGKYDDAIKENEIWSKKTGNELRTRLALAHIYALAGRREDAKKIIEKPGLENSLGNNDCRNVGIVYAALGETDKTFEWLEKSYSRHEESLSSLKVDPKFEILHADPRFNKLIKLLKLPD